MQSHETHFFLVTLHKEKSIRHVSPMAFPAKEAERRKNAKGPVLKKTWRFVLAEAPSSHPRWRKEFRSFSIEEHRKRVRNAQALLEEHNYYGLMEAEL